MQIMQKLFVSKLGFFFRQIHARFMIDSSRFMQFFKTKILMSFDDRLNTQNETIANKLQTLCNLINKVVQLDTEEKSVFVIRFFLI